MEVSGTIRVGESAAALGYVRTRRGLSPRQSVALLLLCMVVVGLPVATWAANSWLFGLIAVEGVVMGLAVGLVVVRALSGPLMRKALVARGQADALPMTLTLTADGLVQDLDDVTLTARWACVTDVFRTRKHWVFLVQSSAIVLPRRFFAAPEAERAYLTDVVARLPEASRARSPDAVRAAGR